MLSCRMRNLWGSPNRLLKAPRWTYGIDFSQRLNAARARKAFCRDYFRVECTAMQIIDSHAHLEFPQFDADRDAMLNRARDAGIEKILAIGSGTASDRLDAAIPFAEKHDWIYATVGVHPHESKLATEEW